jgi:PTH1 family peptidyl-tRNA hydrolase
MWLVVGLGNPGKKYTRNRHNVGFMVADELVSRHGLSPWREKFGGEVSSGFIGGPGGEKALVLKPMEYMNHSGYAVTRAAHFQQIEPERILVIHDEIDLPMGRLRLKAGGGHGGHNGLRSIVGQLGSKDFLRIRVGVGKPLRPGGAPADGRVSRHVLSDFPADQQDELDSLIRGASDAAEAVLARGIRAAMNDFNGPAEDKKSQSEAREADKSAETEPQTE